MALTREPGEASRLAASALAARKWKCIVAVGGDGTINEVVNGFFDTRAVPDRSACLGVLPSGTGGDFGRTYALRSGWRAAAERLAREEERDIDVGQVRYRSSAGTDEVRYFANVCSLGVSGEIVREVNRGESWLGGRLGFAWASVRALRHSRDRAVSVSFDGAAPQVLKVTALAVANGRFFGGGMRVAPSADPSDGLFDVTVWSGFRARDFLFRARSIYSGRHVFLSGTRTFRCRRLSVLSADGGSEPVPVELDGEQLGTVPCEVKLLPAALRLRL